METLDKLAGRLAWARNRRKWSQQDLADKSGVAQSTIGSLEAGTRKTARRITAIAAALGVSSEWLAEGKGAADSVKAQTPAALAPEGARKLQWVDDAEAELLSQFRACGQAEQATSIAILRNMPKAVVDDKRSDQA